MSLPAEPEIKVTYKVNVGAEAAGSFTMSGKFSYIDNNEKKVFNLENKNITISSGDAVAKTTNTSTETGAGTSTETQSATTETTSNTAATSNEGTGGVSITRTISNVEKNGFTVTLNINKGAVSGFAKLEETLPAGATATGGETQNAVFSFVDQKAKFLWMSVPTQSNFTISYQVKTENLSNVALEGLFSYLENDVTQKYTIKSEQVTLGEGAIASNNKTEPNTNTGSNENATATSNKEESTTASTGSTSTETNTSASTETKTENSTAANNKQNVTANNTGSSSGNQSKNTSGSVTKMTGGQAGVVFRVQILATHKNVATNTISTLYAMTEPINAEMHEGWHKYTIGGFNQYKEARDKRETVSTKGITGPFVTAYNNGSRITVQEALMVSSQKWIR
jgi:hypothetical protein